MNNRIRVFLADDHELILAGLQKLLAECDDMEVVGTATDGRRALDGVLSDKVPWDVLVLDLSLPRVGGMEVLHRVMQERPGARVVVLTMYPEEQYALQLLHAGASAFVSKAAPPESFIEAIRTVAAGGTWTSESVARRLRMGHPGEEKPPHMTLTSREHQVFSLLIEGNAVADIAAQLDVTSSTVSNHIAAIRTKLSVRTIADIVKYAHRVGLID